jgi:hypothetical protein
VIRDLNFLLSINSLESLAEVKCNKSLHALHLCFLLRCLLKKEAAYLEDPFAPPRQGVSGFPDGLRLPQRLELEIDPDLYERIEKLSIRSGRSIPEIIQGLISCSFPINPAETVLGESLS